MYAIILAAGMGERLRPLTANCPKSLLDLGDGTTILERQLAALSEAGISDVRIVTGYLSEQIEAKTRAIAGVEICYNPFYRSTNNLISAWLGCQNVKGDFMVINGDDVFGSSVIQTLLGAPGEMTMLIDEKEEYDLDDMKILMEGDRITKVGKDLAIANGESIGIMKFCGWGARAFVDILNEMVRDQKEHDAFYLTAMQELMNRGHHITAARVTPGSWAEIDFHPDLVQVRKHVASLLSQSKR